MKRISIITAPCRHCGKPVATASRSILGLDELKARYGVVCSDCITGDEVQTLLIHMGEGIISKRFSPTQD